MFLSAQGQHEAALAQLTDAVKRNAEVDPDIAYSGCFCLRARRFARRRFRLAGALNCPRQREPALLPERSELGYPAR